MISFVLREGRKIILVWQIEELQFSQDICETLRRNLLKLAFFCLHLFRSQRKTFTYSHIIDLLDVCLNGDVSLFIEECFGGGVVLTVDHLYLIDQSSLCAILDGNVVVVVYEVFHCRFLNLPIFA